MIAINVKVDISRALAKLDNFKKNQVPFATAKALTKTAQAVAEAERKEMRDVFDRPTPYTMAAIYVKSATKKNLVAKVGIKNFAGKGNPASKFLAAQITGGTRRQKKFEKALQAVGAMPHGYFAVPGSGAKLDQYGNIMPSLIVQLLSYFKAFPEMGYKANMTDKRKAQLAKGKAKRGIQGVVYFVGRPGGNSANYPLGIWARYTFNAGSFVSPVLIFVPHAQYKAIFDFYYVGKKVVERVFKTEFRAAMAEAMATAK